MIRYVDLFAGIGGIRKGLDIALESNKINSECVFSSEIDKNSQETYRLNFFETPDGDIREVNMLPDHDILLAGFPCQSFSYAGKQRGFVDTRGTLFFEIERLLTSIKNKPKILFLENVRGFTTHDKGRTYQTILNKLNELGYSVTPLLLNSSNFGVPQNRVRIYLICTLGFNVTLSITSHLGSSDSHKFKKSIQQGYLISGIHPHKCVSEILEENPDSKYLCTDIFKEQLVDALNSNDFTKLNGVRLIDYRGGNSIHSWDLGTKGHCSKEEKELMNLILGNRRKKHFGADQDGKMLTLEQILTFSNDINTHETLNSLVKKGYLRYRDNKYNPTCGNMSFEVFKFLDPDSISITIVSSDAHRLGVVQNGIPRRITPRECARIQGFPDDFILNPNDTYAYKQLGNSVSVPVVASILNDLIKLNIDYIK